jgi:hypothetical protein
MRYYAGLAERWDIICRCVEVRARSLRQIHQLWTEADTERDRLASWLAGVERMLRNAWDSIHLVLLNRIRIHVENVDPDPGVRKLTKIYKVPFFQPFKNAVGT